MLVNKLKPGDILASRYRIERWLGSGGMSHVLLAEDLKVSGKQWAVKESQHHARRPNLFVREAAAMAALEHPFLPKIADFYPPDEDGFSYIVMEYIRGETLQARFDRLPAMDWQEAVRYAAELCELFDYLHRLQPEPIIFRDLKPSNVMVDPSGHIRLIDFGIARKRTTPGQAETLQLGTAGFAAPEQFRADGVCDERTDLFTLGAVLYYLLSGGRYYRDNREPLSSYRPELPHRLQQLIGRLLASTPEERPGSAEEVRESLLELLIPRLPVESASPFSAAPAARKLVLIGGLFAGAGTTFVTMSLAGALHRFGSEATVIEAGCNVPELYSLLDIGGIARESLRGIGHSEPANPWISSANRGTTWWTLPPAGMEQGSWSSETVFRALLQARDKPVFIDLASHWHDPVIRDLLALATDVVVVAAPSAARTASPAAFAIWELLLGPLTAGKAVHVVANRDCPFGGRVNWLRMLPIDASATLPELAASAVRNVEWEGTAAVENEELWELLRPGMMVLLQAVFPERSFVNRRPIVRWFGKKRKLPLA